MCALAPRVRRMVLAGLLASVPIATVSPARTSAWDVPDLAALRTAAAAELVLELEQLADWCHRQRLHRLRDEAFEAILRFEPDHALARKHLRYFRTNGQPWRRSPGYRPAKNLAREDLEEGLGRRSAVVRSYRDRVLALLERHAGEVTPLAREAALEELAALDPEDERVRGLRGEVRAEDGSWILAESARAHARHGELERLARALLEHAPEPVEDAASAPELALGIAWKAVVRVEQVRALGSGPRRELEACARSAAAAMALVRAALPARSHPEELVTLYVLHTPAERDTFLRARSDLDAAERERARGYGSVWLDAGRELAVWAAPHAWQVEAAVRQAIARQLSDSYGLSGRVGPLYEGLGIHMTRLLLGEHSTSFAPQVQAQLHGAAQGRRASKAGAPDPALAELERWSAGATPDLAQLLGEPLDALGSVEVAAGCALARYLVEGCPERAADLLESLESGASHEHALAASLGHAPEVLGARLARWARETR